MKTTRNPFSHVDLHVPSLEKALPFYQKLLSALGFGRSFDTPAWKVFAAEGELPSAAYFAITESPVAPPNDTTVGFWVEDQAEVERIARLIGEGGGKINDGPRIFPISPTYYAVFFEDPWGNKFECTHRRD